jgi:hypothetical protein
MRFLILVKHPENPGTRRKAFLEAMTKLGEDAAKSGMMIASGGWSRYRRAPGCGFLEDR